MKTNISTIITAILLASIACYANSLCDEFENAGCNLFSSSYLQISTANSIEITQLSHINPAQYYIKII
jgi:hypothetical protein